MLASRSQLNMLWGAGRKSGQALGHAFGVQNFLWNGFATVRLQVGILTVVSIKGFKRPGKFVVLHWGKVIIAKRFSNPGSCPQGPKKGIFPVFQRPLYNSAFSPTANVYVEIRNFLLLRRGKYVFLLL